MSSTKPKFTNLDDAKYFVATSGDYPERIFFNQIDAAHTLASSPEEGVGHIPHVG